MASGLKEKLDAMIFYALTGSPLWKTSENILIYASLPDEINTFNMISKALSEGKTVALPRCTGPSEMHFYRISSLLDLEEGSFHVQEPKSYCCDEITDGLLIVPGSAFDCHGNRIGYGGGYYDHWMHEHCGFSSTALSYDFQIIDSIPAEETDIPVEKIITPSKIIDCH